MASICSILFLCDISCIFLANCKIGFSFPRAFHIAISRGKNEELHIPLNVYEFLLAMFIAKQNGNKNIQTFNESNLSTGLCTRCNLMFSKHV